MKRTITIMTLLILLAALAACGSRGDRENASSSAETAETTAAPAEDDAAAARDRFVGSWHLDDANDLVGLDPLFPSAALFGGGMEIRSDGMISWYIGSAGAVGSYEIQGKYLVTDVVDELDGETHHVVMGFQEDRLYMNHKDVVLVWSRSEDAPRDEG